MFQQAYHSAFGGFPQRDSARTPSNSRNALVPSYQIENGRKRRLEHVQNVLESLLRALVRVGHIARPTSIQKIAEESNIAWLSAGNQKNLPIIAPVHGDDQVILSNHAIVELLGSRSQMVTPGRGGPFHAGIGRSPHLVIRSPCGINGDRSRPSPLVDQRLRNPLSRWGPAYIPQAYEQ